MNLALGVRHTARLHDGKIRRDLRQAGLHPDWGGTYFLPRIVGMAKAAELIFTGDIIDAPEALRLGIVSAVHPPADLLPAAYSLASKIAAGPPIAIRLARRALHHKPIGGAAGIARVRDLRTEHLHRDGGRPRGHPRLRGENARPSSKDAEAQDQGE
jgi:enoyl-CoA hydratase/carnithine racemase